MSYIREDGRAPNQLRMIEFIPRYIEKAYSSCLAKLGMTWVLCTVSLVYGVPSWKESEGGGWLTAEYDMLPASTGEGRMIRDRVKSQISGRSQEIQRLVGRTLRAVCDLSAFEGITLWVDTDVLQADGGTRTTAVNGAMVALHLALSRMQSEGRIERFPLKEFAGAISAGVVENTPMVDLNYIEDSKAEVDMNVVMTGGGKIIEIQGTAERKPFTRDTLNTILNMSEKAVMQIIEKQIKSLGIER
ncbi:MAG: ribonuclease PH [Candidatus Coatesbacteria bacterium]|nr:MAG: ribonuclease PH [Candidatus Coatesbacteria bacterium]RLC42655.1 MAG: ribonuclease PH [Candidatus Coatesbacteria bacterium]